MTGGGWAAPDDNPLNQVALVDGELRVRAPVR
jgi:hypothetical protein